MKIRRVDQQLTQAVKPSVFNIKSVSLGPDDALVVCAGFEDRSLSILRAARQLSQASSRVVIIEYRPQIVGNRLDECLSECARMGVTPAQYVYDRENPVGAAGEIWSLVEGSTGRIYVDISGMSRLLIVQLIAGIADIKRKFDRVTILYAEAERYYPSLEQFKALVVDDAQAAPLQFLSWGVSQITVVPELSSVALLDQPTHLIAFPTLDPQQFSAVRKDVEPSILTVIDGRPLHQEDQWRLVAVRTLNRTTLIRGITEWVTSTYDYRETLAELLRLYSGEGRLQRLVVSPTGSKLQTVAVGIFRAFLDDVRIVYPTPRSFKTGAYTSGMRQLHRLDLDSFSSVLRAADKSWFPSEELKDPKRE